MKMLSGEEIVFPQNGYALLSDLTHSYCRVAHNDVKELENAIEYGVLRYWNRRWEYPFVMYSIQHGLEKGGIVLDAGAGKSLLPFWLAENAYRVVAFDMDDGAFYPADSLKAWYEDHNRSIGSSVDFVKGDIQQMRFADGTFDSVCCMSVLEHVSNPIASLRELLRVLKPSGILVVTVDISLDGSRPLSMEQYQEMKSHLDQTCSPLYSSRGMEGDSLTTDWFRKNDPMALPWGRVERPIRDRIKAFARGDIRSTQKWYQHFDSMAVAGLAYKKQTE